MHKWRYFSFVVSEAGKHVSEITYVGSAGEYSAAGSAEVILKIGETFESRGKAIDFPGILIGNCIRFLSN